MKATNPNWEKWRPRNPTSPHWYDEARLQRYLAAHVARDRDLGQQPHGARIHRRVPRALQHRHSAQDPDRGRLLPSIAGELLRRRPGERRRHRQAARGDAASTASRSRRSISASSAPNTSNSGSWPRAATPRPSSIKPQRRDRRRHPLCRRVRLRAAPGRPGARRPACRRVFVTGANWSAAIGNPFRRFGSTGEGLENTLAKVRANGNQPVICALHLASARLQFADRGKIFDHPHRRRGAAR